MAYDFPASPTVGATFTSGGITYTWNGYGWVQGLGGAVTLTASQIGVSRAVAGATDVQTALTTLNTNVNGKVAKAGDTMTGPLVLPADPTAALQAATKQYVDGKFLGSG